MRVPIHDTVLGTAHHSGPMPTNTHMFSHPRLGETAGQGEGGGGGGGGKPRERGRVCIVSVVKLQKLAC